MQFHKIGLEDREWVNRCLKEDDRQACEYSFANNYIWRDIYQVEVARSENCAVIRFEYDGEVGYSYPVGNGNKKKVIRELLSMCREEGIPLQMSPLTERDKKNLNQWFPGDFLIEADRDSFDYVYSREKLATLSGRKLHGKRNHIARFKEGDDWRYERMTKAHMEACMEMAGFWAKSRESKWNGEMDEELSAAYEAMKNMDALGLVGGVLYKGDRLAAFTIGEQLNSDTFVVHFEKALPDIQGAYPMINQQFVLDACSECKYVNREEDTGDLSLRKAKLSYYPEILLKKYVAESSKVAFGDKVANRDAICEIWQECFGDDREDILYYLEHRMTENNMFLYWQDGRPVAMASFLPAVYIQREKKIPVRYVYAVGTLPAYRNRGIASELLKLGEEYWKEPLVLCPAEGTLWKYYEKLGFQKAFCCRIEDIMPSSEADSIELIAELPEAADYKIARDVRFGEDGYLEWPEEAIAFALLFHSRFEGKCVKVMDRSSRCEESSGWILYHIEENCVVILEHTLTDTILQKAAAKLLVFEKKEKVIWKIPGGMLRDSFGICMEPKEDGYLNLVMD